MSLKNLRASVSRVAMLLLCCACSTAFAAEESAPSVATVTPIAHSLTVDLLRGTGVQTTFLPPKRLPVNRIENWLRKNRSKRFAAFDALVSISDAVPGLAFSHTLRQSNIRLVTVDIAYARLPEGEKVVLHDPDEYFWLNTNNLLLMLGILKRDLNRLWPEHRLLINENYQTIAGDVRRFNLTIDGLLDDHDLSVLVFDRPRLRPLAASLSLDVMTLEEAQAMGVRALRVGPKPARSTQNAPLADEPLWQVDDLSRYADASFLDRQRANLDRLRQVLD